MEEMPTPRPAYILKRGEYALRGELVGCVAGDMA